MKWMRRIGWACKWLAHAIGSLVLWTFWLLLAACLVVQIIIACSHELRVPTRLVQSFQDRLSVAGLRLKFDSATFDPSGHVLIENVEIRTDGFEEPLAVCPSLYVHVEPWLLPLGIVEADTISAHGLTLYVPPMWSPSGASEPILQNTTLALDLEPNAVRVRELVGHSGPIALSCQGSIHRLPVRLAKPGRVEKAVSDVVQTYLRASRQLALWQARIAAFEEPSIQLTLVPDEKTGARLAAVLRTKSGEITGATIDRPEFKTKVQWRGLSAQTEFPLQWEAPADLAADASVENVSSTDGSALTDLRAHLRVRVEPKPFAIQLGEISASATQIRSHGIAVSNAWLELPEFHWPRVSADANFRIADQTWNVQLSGDVQTPDVNVMADGSLSEPILQLAGARAGRDFSPLLELHQPVPVSVRSHLGAGWKPTYATAAFDARDVLAHQVALKRVAARIFYGGDNLSAEDIVLEQEENIARGSYSMNTKSLDYRFLLTGKLRPVGIAGWFHEWWTHFWNNFDFSAAPPVADVDVQGRWREPHRSTVFVFADATQPTIRTVPFDRVRTILFIRPDYYDALEIEAKRGAGMARGKFTRSVDLEKHDFLRMDFTVDTTLDLQESARIFGEEGTDIVDPFRFDHPPHLRMTGHLDGEDSEKGKHHEVSLSVDSTGPFRFFDFPLSNLQCRATVRDRTIDLPDIHVTFAGGTAVGKARVTGAEEDRRLNFEADLADVNLGEAIHTLEDFGTERRGQKPAAQSAFQARVASGKLNLHAAAAGLYHDPYSFVGQGTADLHGAELAQINLLGSLSEALRSNSVLGFTSWRLDTAQATFKLARNKIEFSTLNITGPTAKLDSHGTYWLNDKAINFHAKFYPFEEGKTLLANAVDLVLTPVSNVLTLKLTGTLTDPKWFFEYGPTNLFRKIAGDESKHAGPAASETPAPAPLIPEPPPLLRK